MINNWFLNLFHSVCFVLLILVQGFAQESEKHDGDFSFGLIADCQYSAVEGTGERKYNLSEEKLKECVNQFNVMELKFVVHLGDFIDRDFESFDVVSPLYDQLNMANYHVLGNHDFSVSDELKKDVPDKLNMPAKYYDYKVNGWRFIVLDGNDISFHAYPKNSVGYNNASDYYKEQKIGTPKWNGAIGINQINWLKAVLDKSSKKGEKVVLFCHFPIYPENVHNLWNAGEVIELIENYSCVKAYINGHNHAGNYEIKEGIHYLTLQGMVDTDQNSYAIINVNGNVLKVTGFGREESRLLEIR